MVMERSEYKVRPLGNSGGVTYYKEDEKIWYGIDLDGTLAHFEDWRGVEYIGEPIQPMIDFLKELIDDGKDVRIFTARVDDTLNFIFSNVMDEDNVKLWEEMDDNLKNKISIDVISRATIINWCKEHIGFVLPITNSKDYLMRGIYDDIAIQVVKNTGELLAAPYVSQNLAEHGATPHKD